MIIHIFFLLFIKHRDIAEQKKMRINESHKTKEKDNYVKIYLYRQIRQVLSLLPI